MPRPQVVQRDSGPDLVRALVVMVLLLAWPVAAGAQGVQVVVEGVSGELEKNVRAFLSVTELTDKASPDPSRVRWAHRRAEDEIRQSLQPFGYYSPRIESRLNREEGGWQARYRIEPGPPTRVTRLDLRLEGPGAADPALKKVIAESELAEGEPLRHSAYGATRQQLIERAMEVGYLEARFARHRIEVHPDRQEAAVSLILDTGPAYYFGEVRIEQGILAPEFIDRFSPIAPGDRLTSSRLLDLQFALSDSGYFNRVEVDVQREQADPFLPAEGKGPEEGRQVPVVVRTTPRPPRHYRIGMGYGSDTGPRLTLGVGLRRLNRWGHRARADLLLSPVKRNLATQYIVPIKDVRTDQMTFSASYNQEELGDGRSTKTTFGVSRDIVWHDWRRNLYIKYALERSRFSGDSQESKLLTPGISLSRTVADDPLFPRRGWSLFVDYHGAREGFLADTSFTQLRGRTNLVFPLGPRIRLLGRAEAGSSFLSRFRELPASERFYAGGARSVRGYGYQSLGPVNDEGDVVGGRHLLVASAEAELRVWGRWGVAAFYDAGNAGNEWPPEPLAGTGGGLRWASPIGMIRLDYAVPLDRRKENWRIHFSMGPDL